MIDPKNAYDMLMGIEGVKWRFKGVLRVYNACSGYAKKDIVLSIDEDILRIRAKREPEEELRSGSIYCKQRPRQIDKKIILPFSLQDGQKVAGAAVYIDGVITIRIPTVQPKNIQIL